MKLDLKHSLSLKLLRVVLLSALIVGLVLSCAQIVFDIYKTRQTVANDAQRILAMFSDPSTQAVYSLDREMGLQVIEGLFQNDSVRYAAIGHPNEPVLAEKLAALNKALAAKLSTPMTSMMTKPWRIWRLGLTVPASRPLTAAPPMMPLMVRRKNQKKCCGVNPRCSPRKTGALST